MVLIRVTRIATRKRVNAHFFICSKLSNRFLHFAACIKLAGSFLQLRSLFLPPVELGYFHILRRYTHLETLYSKKAGCNLQPAFWPALKNAGKGGRGRCLKW